MSAKGDDLERTAKLIRTLLELNEALAKQIKFFDQTKKTLIEIIKKQGEDQVRHQNELKNELEQMRRKIEERGRK